MEVVPYDSVSRYLIFDRGANLNEEVISTMKSFCIEPKRITTTRIGPRKRSSVGFSFPDSVMRSRYIRRHPGRNPAQASEFVLWFYRRLGG
jgi:hypothetical protein